jgi:hypothetical protein
LQDRDQLFDGRGQLVHCRSDVLGRARDVAQPTRRLGRGIAGILQARRRGVRRRAGLLQACLGRIRRGDEGLQRFGNAGDRASLRLLRLIDLVRRVGHVLEGLGGVVLDLGALASILPAREIESLHGLGSRRLARYGVQSLELLRARQI